MLDTRAYAQRQRIAQLLRELQSSAIQLAGSPETEEIGLCLELDVAIESPFRRTFWTEPPRFDTVDLTEFTPDAKERQTAFQQLAELRHLNWAAMRFRVRQILALKETPTLGDLIHTHPPEGGVIEVLGYLQIAAEDDHLIDACNTENVVVPADKPGGRPILLTLPRVMFVPSRRNGNAR